MRLLEEEPPLEESREPNALELELPGKLPERCWMLGVDVCGLDKLPERCWMLGVDVCGLESPHTRGERRSCTLEPNEEPPRELEPNGALPLEPLPIRTEDGEPPPALPLLEAPDGAGLPPLCANAKTATKHNTAVRINIFLSNFFILTTSLYLLNDLTK